LRGGISGLEGRERGEEGKKVGGPCQTAINSMLATNAAEQRGKKTVKEEKKRED